MLAKIVAPGVIEIMGLQAAPLLFSLNALHGVLILVLSLLSLALIRRQRRSPPDQKLQSVLPGLLILATWGLFLIVSLIADASTAPGPKDRGQRLIRMDAAEGTLLFSESPRLPDISLPLDWIQTARIQHSVETRAHQPDPDRIEEDQVFRHYLDLAGGLEMYLGETRFTTKTRITKTTIGNFEVATNPYSLPVADLDKQKLEIRPYADALSRVKSIPLITTQALALEHPPEWMEALRPRGGIPENLIERARASLKELEQADSKTWCWKPPSSWRLMLFLLCAGSSLIAAGILGLIPGLRSAGSASIRWKMILPSGVLGGLLILAALGQWNQSRGRICVSTARDQISTWQEPNGSRLSHAKRDIKVLHHSSDSGYLYLGTTKAGKLSQLTPVEADQAGIFLTLQGLPLEQDISLWLMIQASLNEH